MSVPLHTHGKVSGITAPMVGRIAREPRRLEERRDHIRLLSRPSPDEELSGYLAVAAGFGPLDCSEPTVHGLAQVDHLADGDIVRIGTNGYVRTLYRVASPHNALFATDQCNSYCLMCSQPPKPVDDDRLAEHLRLLDLIAPAPAELGITGGEPTLLKDGLVQIIARAKERLPDTALHVLSNGRLFRYAAFAGTIAAVRHPDLMIGVPLYADVDYLHDHVVQARGAFGQTLLGLQNLGRHGVPVEIRVVLHRLTVDRLEGLAEFIYRNLTFAAHVTFMGLELMGFAVPNLDELWVEPTAYVPSLGEAVSFLARRGMRVSIYNLPLCVLPRTLWPYVRKSISDWKNDYLPECQACTVVSACGGFFASALKRRLPAGIHPLPS